MKYVCSVCGYIYDEAKEKTPFAALPDSWVCPLCGAPKSAFVAQDAPKTEAAAAPVPVMDDDELQELSAGELSALFSNLARGCEKQYQADEAALFTEIAGYFEKAVPPVDGVDVDALAELIRQDLDSIYPAVEAIAKEHKDRGTLRAYTWGNKVTRMQQALVGQYLREGEAMLEHTNVWVCTVCGFIYVGENPPALCPVCKVPDWKFVKMEGGAEA